MKKYLVASCISLLMLAFTNDNAGSMLKHANTDSVFRQLHALKGEWIMKNSRRTMGEYWAMKNDHYLQGKGFYVKGNDTVITESISLQLNENGIFYTSTVMDQNDSKAVSFKLTASRNRIFVFENNLHDFPKRIVYNLLAPDSIHAYIDGGENALNKRQDFYYKKVK